MDEMVKFCEFLGINHKIPLLFLEKQDNLPETEFKKGKCSFVPANQAQRIIRNGQVTV